MNQEPGGKMFNIEYLSEIGSTAYGKTVTSILAGTVGAVILVAFLNVLVLPAGSVKFLPLIIAFNTAVTGYMVIDKTREYFRHKRFIAVLAGTAATLLVFITLNAFFLHATGFFLINPTELWFMLAIGIGSSWFGSILAIRYLNLD